MNQIYNSPKSHQKQAQSVLHSKHIQRRQRLDSLLHEVFEKRANQSVYNPLASFCYYPLDVSFLNKDPEEDIILFIRKHPVTNLGWILLAFFLLVLPAFISVLPLFELLPFSYQIVFGILWYLFVFTYMFEKFLGWFYHVNIITDERIVEVDFLNLIYREMTDANIDQIQDVTVTVGGGFRTMFNFGDVQVQTAAGIPEICFEAVPRPDVVAKVLRDLRVEEEQEKLSGRVR